MTKENIIFNLPTNDKCELQITELNHGVVALQPIITLNTTNLPHGLFQNIVDHLIPLNKSYIKSIYFESVKFHYKIISFNLYGHVRAAFKKELKIPIKYNDLINNNDNYNWIEPGFFPKFSDDIDELLNFTEKRIISLYYASKKGNIDGVNYQFGDPDFQYNYVYDLHPTDLIPVFDTYLRTTIHFPNNTPYDKQENVKKIITKKYINLDSNIIFI